MLKRIKVVPDRTRLVTEICDYKPKRLSHESIEKDLNQMFGRGAATYSTVRDREENGEIGFTPTAGADRVRDWHQDTMSCRWVIVWSNRLPTRVRSVETKEEIKLKPNKFYIIDNIRVEHRFPTFKQLGNRWFIRIAGSQLGIKDYTNEKEERAMLWWIFRMDKQLL